MSYNVLIVEDDLQIAESLAEILRILKHKVAGIAASYEEAIDLLTQDDIELVLLDIQLKGEKTGIDIAEFIKENHEIPFIFTSAYADKETIKNASEHSPYGYIVKPYGMKDIDAAIEVGIQNHKYFSELTNDKGGLFSNDNLFVKYNARIVRISIQNINYIEASGDYVIFKTPEKGYIVNTTFKKVESKLDPNKFVKVHRSYIINLDKVVDIQDNSLLIAEQVIPISRSQRAELYKKLDLI